MLIGIQHRVDGLMDGALRQAAHPEQAFFQFVQIFFEVSFHYVFPYAGPLPWRRIGTSSRSRLNHPKRPVIYASVRGSPGVVKFAAWG